MMSVLWLDNRASGANIWATGEHHSQKPRPQIHGTARYPFARFSVAAHLGRDRGCRRLDLYPLRFGAVDRRAAGRSTSGAAWANALALVKDRGRVDSLLAGERTL